MFLWKKTKKEPPPKSPREIIRETLASIAYNADAARQTELRSFDSYSLVCFVNEDFPEDKQAIHVSEAASDFIFYVGQQPDTVQWMERQKLTSRKDKIIIYKLPAEHMQDLYTNHIRNRREGKPTPFKTLSVIIYDGKAYPVAFCLGFLWGSQTVNYNEYPSTRL